MAFLHLDKLTAYAAGHLDSVPGCMCTALPRVKIQWQEDV